MKQPGFPGLPPSLTCDRKAARFSLRGRLRRTLVPWTHRIGVLSAAPTSFGRPPARATSRSWCAGCATGPRIPGSDDPRQTDRRTSPFAACSLRRSSRTNERTDPRDRDTRGGTFTTAVPGPFAGWMRHPAAAAADGSASPRSG